VSAAAASASRGPLIADIGQHYRGPDRDISKHSNKSGPFVITDTNPYNHLENDESEPIELMSNIITNDDSSVDSSAQNTKQTKTMLTVEGVVNGKPARILIDSGSSKDFVSADFIQRHKLKTTTTQGGHVTLADGRKQLSKGCLTAAHVRMVNHHYKIDLSVLPLTQYDVILGMNWLRRYRPLIDWSALTFEPTVSQSTDVHTSSDLFYSADTIKEHVQTSLLDNEDVVTDCSDILREYADVFGPLPNRLPPTRDVDHHIDLEPGSVPPSRSTYRMSGSELEVLRKQLDDLLAKGYIQPSKSPYGAPILFVKKKSGELRMCVDYRALNKITIKNRSQMPRQDELLDRIRGACVFTKIDLRSGYHQIKIHPDDVPKTAFNTRYGHFEFNVLPFGLTNAPATFQTMMNSIFSDFVDDFLIVYIDDILIFSRNAKEHREHVRKVLQRLREHQLYANSEKCEFGRSSINFLGHVVSKDGISMASSKLEDIRNWPVPKTVEDVRSFLGLTGYYRRFIHKFSQIAAPLSNLTRKLVPFLWTDTEQKAFEDLKTAMLNGPVLTVPNETAPFIVTADASGYAVGASLSQDLGLGPQPVAFMSHRMTPAQMNYPVHEQELLAIMLALREWHHYLYGQRFTVITDHHSLTFLQTQPKLSKRQVRWTEELANFDYEIIYSPGKTNVVADSLSRRSDHRESAAAEAQALLATLTTTDLKVGEDFLEEIRRAYQNDPECAAALANPAESAYTVRNGLLYRPDNRLRIPSDDSIKGTILFEAHDSIVCGHVGVNKTARMVGRLFDWPGLRQDVRRYVTTCIGCQANKPSNQRPIGLLQPLPIPKRRWEMVTMDLITQLPISRQQNDAIIVFVDKYSKMVHYAPCKTAISAPEVAQIFFREVVRHHGIPDSIVSDRDSRFMSNFWQALWKELGSRLKMSTAYHPQTDGQTEKANRTLEEMLRGYVNYAQDNWDEKLLAVEIAVNSSVHESTGFTPYYLNYGQHPHLPLSKLTETTDNELAQIMLRNLRDNLATARTMLLAAQQKQSRDANKSRREYEFAVGEQVMLSTENLNVGARARKLVAKFAGPHKIIEHPTPNTYRLELPPELSRIHPVFNSSQLKPFRDDNVRFTDRPRINRPPPIIEEGEEKHFIEDIKAYRVRRGVGEFLVKWAGFPDSDSSWRPTKEVDASYIVERFLQRNPAVRLQLALAKKIKFVHGGEIVRVVPAPNTKQNKDKERHVSAPKPATLETLPATKPTTTETLRRSKRLADKQ
jgi:hypothetical protein